MASNVRRYVHGVCVRQENYDRLSSLEDRLERLARDADDGVRLVCACHPHQTHRATDRETGTAKRKGHSLTDSLPFEERTVSATDSTTRLEILDH